MELLSDTCLYALLRLCGICCHVFFYVCSFTAFLIGGLKMVALFMWLLKLFYTESYLRHY